MRRHNIYKDIDYALKTYLKTQEIETNLANLKIQWV